MMGAPELQPDSPWPADDRIVAIMLYIIEPVDGGYNADWEWFGDRLVVASVQDGKPNLTSYAWDDLVAWADRAEQYASQPHWIDEETGEETSFDNFSEAVAIWASTITAHPRPRDDVEDLWEVLNAAERTGLSTE
jgi:hypothetical protein